MTDPNLKTPRSIAERRTFILDKIHDSAKRIGRTGDDVTLVAVSKVQPDDRITAALACGHCVFGENRVQEAQARWGERFAERRADIELRLIGPLQTNKAQDACALFDVIETLDREKLAKALAKAAEKIGRIPRLFVQVNTGDEAQKAGISIGGVDGFLKTLRTDYDLHPEGLMCIPPANQAASPHFALLRKLAEANGLSKLSMGMSGDYAVAAAMGATSVRVGSAFFGARDYS